MAGEKLDLETIGARVPLAILIQAFAFFFLRLYRSSHDGIRYYQNELTNVESRLAAARAAAIMGETTVLNTILMQLAQTERNFKLQKGESTIDLRKQILDQAGDKEVMEQARRAAGGGRAADDGN